MQSDLRSQTLSLTMTQYQYVCPQEVCIHPLLMLLDVVTCHIGHVFEDFSIDFKYICIYGLHLR